MNKGPLPQLLAHIYHVLLRLPPTCQWGVEITDEWSEVPAVISVFVDNETQRVALRDHLSFGRPTDETETTETHQYSKVLTVVIIER